jgi:hypothetical protein
MTPEQEEAELIGHFIEVELEIDPVTGNSNAAFLKVKETLGRIGIASKKEKTLYQTCHILHKKGRYYIVHFLEMFMLDGKDTNFSEDDLARRNTIADLLDQWGLLTIIDKGAIVEPRAPIRKIKIVPFKEKSQWRMEAKYNIGGTK